MKLVHSPFLDLTGSKASIPTSAPPLSDCLSGLRLAVKDLFHIKGFPTSAGNPQWLNTHPLPEHTASSVQHLLNHGAVFCGKTITDELAYSLNGQNIHYGTPVNPITPERLPGGSSSGSAVAVSANLADIGLGTDTGGSIRVPSSYQGLFGLRPTHGAIATDGMVALAPSFDTVGFMTRDLGTLAAIADVLLHEQPVDDVDTLTLLENLNNDVKHSQPILKQIQVWRKDPHLPPIGITQLDVERWKTADTFRILQGAEIWQQHGEWLERHKPDIAQDIQIRLNDCKVLTAEEINSAKAQRRRFSEAFNAMLSQHGVFILPTTPGLSPTLTTPSGELAGYRSQLLSMTAIAGLTGCPQLHLPLFTLNGAPCGLSLLGPRGSDRTLIALALKLRINANEEK